MTTAPLHQDFPPLQGAIRSHYSLAEFSALGLPGLPATPRGMDLYATEHQWVQQSGHVRPRNGRGGGMEYSILLLPPEARLKLLASCLPQQAQAGINEIALAPDMTGGVQEQARAQRDARLHIIGLYKAFANTSGLATQGGRGLALASFCTLYNAGKVPVPAWVSLKNLSARTLVRWLDHVRCGKIDRLAVDRGAARRGRGILDLAEGGEVMARILGLHAHQPHLTASHLRMLCRDAFGDTLDVEGKAVPMPGIRAFQTALNQIKTRHKTELLAISNPDAFKSRMRISGSRAHLVTRLNELWEIDASPADMLCTDGRHTIYVCVDVFSRRITCSVSKTARAEAVGLLVRKAILAWGVPERIKTDNGSDFTARSTTRLLAALNIETQVSAPYSPEQKGVVERAIGTLQRSIMPLLDGFIGHSVADRKAIENRRSFSARMGQDDAKAFDVSLSAPAFATMLDTMVASHYEHQPHGGLGKATPFQIAAAWRGPVRRIEDEAALSVLLAPVFGKNGLRTAGKQGIRLEGAFYLMPGLMPGESVFVRCDPQDLGRIWVFAPDGETFRGIATCPEIAGIDPAEAVAAARNAQKQMIAERLEPIRKEAKKVTQGRNAMAQAFLRQAAKDQGTLVSFPKPSTPHATPALAAAAQTLAALDIADRRRAPQAAPASAAQAAMLERMRQDQPSQPAARPPGNPAPSKITPLRTSETPQQRFRRARSLEQALDLGQTIETADALWLGGYQSSAEYRALAKMDTEFGEAALR